MAEYRIVKYCGNCRKKFVVDKSESRRYFCDECEKGVENIRSTGKGNQ